MQIPKDLQTTWKEVTKDKSVSNEDFNKLIDAAAPGKLNKEFDDDEIKFLAGLKSALETTKSKDGTVAITELSFIDPPAAKENSWPGYNEQTIASFKNAFKADVTGGAIPHLKQEKAQSIASTFGEKSISDLQTKVDAKPDGKFGPETFFKIKTFIEEHKDAIKPELLKKVTDIFGNAPEAAKAKPSAEKQPAQESVKPEPPNLTSPSGEEVEWSKALMQKVDQGYMPNNAERQKYEDIQSRINAK
jgi:hypothetical protein